jgi:hypothetical protein
MTVDEVESAVRRRFSVLIADPLNITTVYENDGQPEPTDIEVWTRVTVLTGESVQIELGLNSRFRHKGLLIVCIFVKPRTGTLYAMQLAAHIAGIFRSSVYEGVSYFNTDTQKIGSVNGWFQVNVSCSFRADEIGA